MDARAQKISDTMRARKLDNFKAWRDEQKRLGRIKNEYAPLEKNGDLAELIGVILGDGHIGAHPRCESLRVVGNSNSPGFAYRCADLIHSVFGREPRVSKRSNQNALNITLYQKCISSRLQIPTGARSNFDFILPQWIEDSEEYRIRFLRGLYEAEGSECHHEATYTHKLEFSNKNPALLGVVHRLVQGLGFHPHRSLYKIQVSRAKEVQNLADLLQFRRYLR